MRFPLKLPIDVKAGDEHHEVETYNISAGGVLFHLDSEMDVGSTIEFRIALPASVLGSPADVLVSGSGRVVRCTAQGKRRAVAAVIDEYRFERQQ
jgi:PilZ domain-containing protein